MCLGCPVSVVTSDVVVSSPELSMCTLPISNSGISCQVAAPVGSRARKSGLLFDDEDDGEDFLSRTEVKSSTR